MMQKLWQNALLKPERRYATASIMPVPNRRKLRKFYAIFAGLLFLHSLNAQTIWLEDFSGANQGWTDNFTDCDGTPQSFNGVLNNRYEITDMEGTPCCTTGGGNGNEWITNPINIAGFCNVSITVDYGFIGVFECTPGGPYFGCSGNATIDNGHDQIVFEYSLDGGPWVQFHYVCGGQAGTATVNNLNGNTLQIRIMPANKATAETYWFDNVLVAGHPPTVNPPANITVCAGQPVSVNFSGSSGATFNWTNDNTAIGLGASGTGNISFTSAMVSNQEVSTITVSPTQNGCNGPAQVFTITVNPIPTVTNPGNQSVCSGDDVTITLSGTPSPTLNWTNSNTAIGLGASGSGDIMFTAATVANATTGSISVTPTENGCTGPAVNFSVTVNPLPVVNQPNNVVVCAGQTVTVNFAGTSGASFDWTNDNTNIGLGASGTGNISFQTVPVGNQEVGTITVTPIRNGCPGTPKTFTITVNPLPTVDDPGDQTVCAGENVNIQLNGSGNPNFSWTNSNTNIGLPGSGSGDIAFSAVNNNSGPINALITVTPSASGCTGPNMNFNITVNPLPSASAPNDTTVCGGQVVNIPLNGSPGADLDWTNSNTGIGLASGGTGNIAFTAAVVSSPEFATIDITPTLNGCPGDPVFFNITVNPGPQVNNPGNTSVCSGTPVAINFTGTGGASFNWTNNNTAIGLGASGSGNINFNAATVATAQTAQITVTPASGTCFGPAIVFTITVNPVPAFTNPGPQSACVGAPVSIPLGGTSGATYSWTNSNTAIGLGASGTGNIAFTAAGTTGSGTITVNPSLAGCSGPAQTFTISILSAPAINNPGDTAVCGGTALQIPFSGSGGATFSWLNDNTGIGLPASGTGNINFTASNPGAPDTAQITVTPQLGTCSGPSAVFHIIVNPAAVAAVSGNNVVCNGDSTVLTASGGASYAWNTGAATAAITVHPNDTTSYSAVAITAQGCQDTAFLTVNVLPTSATLLQAASCNPADTGTVVLVLSNHLGCDSTVTTVTTLLPTDSILINSQTCNPAGAGTFVTTLNNQFGCDSVIVTTVIFNPAFIDTTVLMAATCDPAMAGQTQTLLNNQYGCDSLVITNTSLNPTDTLLLQANTCNPAGAGTFVTTLSNQFGCDSVIISTVQYLQPDTTALSAVSCDPAAAGTFVQILTNQFGCDSVLLTTVTFDPALVDTTLLGATTCNPAQAGVSQALFNGFDGCDSLVITTTVLLPSDTTQLSLITCDPAAAGVFSVHLANIFQCDSLVVTTVTFDPALLDTTYLSATTCNPAQVGTTQLLFNGLDGCDSLVITTTTLLPSNVTQLSSVTCDPAAAGVFTAHYTNIYMCDSTVITTVIFDPSLLDTTYLNATTCNPAQAGTSQVLFNGSDGCDSLVITTTTLLPSNVTQLSSVTCDPAAAGVFTAHYTNIYTCDSTVITTVTFDPSLLDTTYLSAATCNPAQAGTTQVLYNGIDGCDSLVITTTALLPSDTTYLNAMTCDPAQAGVSSVLLQNYHLCDSLVITTTLFDPALCVLSLSSSTTPVNCAGGSDGAFTITALNGAAPYTYNWSGPAQSGTGTISSANTPTTVSGLAAGTYTVTVSETNGNLQNVLQITVGQPAPLALQVNSPTPFNGYALSCAGAADGSANAAASGGTGPYQYTWSNGATGPTLTGLSAGGYSVTASDQHGCTQTGAAGLSEPPAMSIGFGALPTDCGDETAAISVQPSGGAAPFTLQVDGIPANGLNAELGSGTHQLEVLDANQCAADTTVQIYIPTVPQISLPQDTSIQLGEMLTLEAQTNLAVWDTLFWRPLPDSTCPGCLQQTWKPESSGFWTVTIVDTSGCVAQASVLVQVKREVLLYVPNAFSPDEDGVNDLFQLGAGPGILNLEYIRIYDRWGELMYDWADPVPVNDWPGWDGTARGHALTPAVFVYVLRIRLIDGSLVDFSGDVTVLR